MQAIEFISQAHDGVVDLPQNAHMWNGRRVHVILLEAANRTIERNMVFKAASISTRSFRFNRDAANAR
jgi:hypothetical protein